MRGGRTPASPDCTDIEALSMSDIQYLEAVEEIPLSPSSPLYTSVYEDLLSRGLVLLAEEGYSISPAGKGLLERHRPRAGGPPGDPKVGLVPA